MTTFSYLIVIIFNQDIEKNNPSERVVKQNQHYAGGQNVILYLCVTRWVKNLDGYSMSLATLLFII